MNDLDNYDTCFVCGEEAEENCARCGVDLCGDHAWLGDIGGPFCDSCLQVEEEEARS